MEKINNMKINNKLTSSEFWKKYWRTKSKLEETIINKNYLFSDILEKYTPSNKEFSFLEIGGYPGYWSIFMAKYLYAKSTLLDRYIDNEIISKLVKVNGLLGVNL